ncbi:hypothetical protein L3X38_006355 [Prunus dulcis]|uniref:Uncharacterized protein n=1 Tax=Prunus dulcis TaxID=3755 RepID=A0AAD5F4X4_PRUDU|nr:hypothetical protein L3X38_006355 [Prunus dulcis]
MEEGSPGPPPLNSRLAKRSRGSEACEVDYAKTANQPLLPESMKDSVPALLVNPAPGGTSFRDKLMNQVNLSKNVGIYINCLDDDYADLNDDEDVVTSHGKKGPTIHFSDRAMNRICKPWTNAPTINLLGRSHTYHYLQTRLQ